MGPNSHGLTVFTKEMEALAITLLSINHRYDDHHRIRFDVMVNGWVPHQPESESCLYAILLFLLLTIISSYGKSGAKRKEVKKEEKLQWVGVGAGAGTGSLLCIGKQLPRCSRAPPTETTLRMGPLKLKTDHQDPTNTALHYKCKFITSVIQHSLQYPS